MAKKKPNKNKFEKQDPYQKITDMVIEKLKAGVVPWRRPWKSNGNFFQFESRQKNFVSKKSYRGINVMLLEMQGYECPYWVSFKQAKELGGKVMKGEQGTPIVYWKKLEVKDEKKSEEQGEDVFKKIMFLKYSTVFNLEQLEGVEIPAELPEDEHVEVEKEEFTPLEKAEYILKQYKNKPSLRHGGNSACYSPQLDRVQMPKKEDFNSVPEYYSTLFHEMVHSTGHKDRLSREGVTDFDRFGSHRYSKEELVAEMGNCFLCSHADIDVTFDNSVAYIENWLKVLKGDNKFLIEAAGKAAEATKYILDLETYLEQEEKEQAS